MTVNANSTAIACETIRTATITIGSFTPVALSQRGTAVHVSEGISSQSRLSPLLLVNFRFQLTLSGIESDSESLVMDKMTVQTVKRLKIRCGSVQLLYSYDSINFNASIESGKFYFYHPVVFVCNKELFKCRQA